MVVRRRVRIEKSALGIGLEGRLDAVLLEPPSHVSGTGGVHGARIYAWLKIRSNKEELRGAGPAASR
jgi:hypothetical protein